MFQWANSYKYLYHSVCYLLFTYLDIKKPMFLVMNCEVNTGTKTKASRAKHMLVMFFYTWYSFLFFLMKFVGFFWRY